MSSWLCIGDAHLLEPVAWNKFAGHAQKKTAAQDGGLNINPPSTKSPAEPAAALRTPLRGDRQDNGRRRHRTAELRAAANPVA